MKLVVSIIVLNFLLPWIARAASSEPQLRRTTGYYERTRIEMDSGKELQFGFPSLNPPPGGYSYSLEFDKNVLATRPPTIQPPGSFGYKLEFDEVWSVTFSNGGPPYRLGQLIHRTMNWKSNPIGLDKNVYFFPNFICRNYIYFSNGVHIACSGEGDGKLISYYPPSNQVVVSPLPNFVFGPPEAYEFFDGGVGFMYNASLGASYLDPKGTLREAEEQVFFRASPGSVGKIVFKTLSSFCANCRIYNEATGTLLFPAFRADAYDDAKLNITSRQRAGYQWYRANLKVGTLDFTSEVVDEVYEAFLEDHLDKDLYSIGKRYEGDTSSFTMSVSRINSQTGNVRWATDLGLMDAKIVHRSNNSTEAKPSFYLLSEHSSTSIKMIRLESATGTILWHKTYSLPCEPNGVEFRGEDDKSIRLYVKMPDRADAPTCSTSSFAISIDKDTGAR